MTTALAKTNFDPEQLAVIEAQFFPSGATKSEQQYCFAVARELGLNPITREIYFVPRRQKVGDKWVNKVEPMVGRDGFLSIAHKSGQIAGIETTCSIQDVPVMENGQWVVKPQLIAVSTVWRKDSSKPFTAQVAYNEYCQKNSDGQPTKFWAEKPETMLKKVAESQSLRKAFNIHGVYCPEELGAGFETESGDIITPTIEAEYSRTVTPPGRLTVVPPAVAPPPLGEVPTIPVIAPPPIQTGPPPGSTAPRPIVIDEDSWPDPPASSTSASNIPSPTLPVPVSTGDSVADEIINLLVGKKIPYEFDREAGVISAKSYDHKELLKQSGFRWSSDLKCWLFKFDPIPF